MLESFLAKYGYIAVLLGTVFEGGEMPEDNSTTVSEESATKKSLLKRMFGLYEIIPIVLILLSIIGIGITDYSPADSRRYWLAMVPDFAGEIGRAHV